MEECPWLDKDFKKGEEVNEYTGPTYGCITDKGTACCKTFGDTPFFELPNDALEVADKLDRPKIHVALVEDELVPVGFDNGETGDYAQFSVEVVKLKHEMDIAHPNGIDEGYTRQGIAIGMPTAGRSFTVSRVGGVFQTSTITEILEESEDGGKFRTLNSVYQWRKIHAEAEA